MKGCFVVKKTLKLLAVLLSFVLVLTSFAACGEKKTDKDEEETKKESVEQTTEKVKGDATHDGKLIATWDVDVEVPLDEGMEPVSVKATMEFAEDGTYKTTIDEESVKDMIIQMFVTMFGLSSEEDFVAFVESQGMTMDDFMKEAMAEFAGEGSFTTTGTWTTDGNGNLTQVSVDSETGEEETEVCKYTVSEDGNKVTLTYTDEESGEEQTLNLTKKK